LICEEPKELNWGEITEKHVRLLEKTIIQKPQFWLWSHNRWKKNTPENLEEIKTNQRLKFQAKFKSTFSETN
jgi:KDO2-lipid IV(A) lauroyltransferase